MTRSQLLILVVCIKMSENRKKQIPLRLSDTLYRELAAWAEDDFRSLKYLLTECVRRRKRNPEASLYIALL